MAIEHYSSLASNRNYKIHNASHWGRGRHLRLPYTIQGDDCAATLALPKQLAQIK